MNRAIDILKKPRLNVLEILDGFTTEQLNQVPAGFNNNIIWNLGHMIATQQGICYKRSGLSMIVSEEFFEAYKPGSKPLKFVGADEIAAIKELLFTSLDQMETDLDSHIFTDYTSIVTRYGVELSNINDAVGFLPFHDGLHIGYMMSLRKLV